MMIQWNLHTKKLFHVKVAVMNRMLILELLHWKRKKSQAMDIDGEILVLNFKGCWNIGQEVKQTDKLTDRQADRPADFSKESCLLLFIKHFLFVSALDLKKSKIYNYETVWIVTFCFFGFFKSQPYKPLYFAHFYSLSFDKNDRSLKKPISKSISGIFFVIIWNSCWFTTFNVSRWKTT